MRHVTLGAIAVALAAGVANAQQVLLITDFSNDRVLAVSPFDGSVINANFITDIGAVGWQFSSPKEAIQVGSEIWVSDQVEDRIHRFSQTGSFLSSIGNAGLDNIRGMGITGNTVYVCNQGTNNGAPGPALVGFDFSGSPVGNRALVAGASPFDVLDYGTPGELLVTNSTSDDVERINSATGALIGQFQITTALQFPQQMFKRSNGNLLVAGFSGAGASGLYEFDSAGNQVGFFLNGLGPRGVFELQNGEYLVTYGGGAGGRLVRVNPQTGDVTTILSGGIDLHYINLVEIPAPGSAALLGLAGLVAVRRRRV